MNIKETLNYFATNLYNKTKNSFVEKEDNKVLSSNDYTDEDKNKLGGLPSDTYNKSEINNALSGKSDTTHTHDDRYYTESEINTKLLEKSDTSHTHDDRYYKKTEVDTKLSSKSDSTHNHDDSYYKKAETYNKTEIDAKFGSTGTSVSELETKVNSNATDIAGLSTSKANATDVYSKTEIDSKFGNASTSVSELEEKVNTNTSNIAANTANIGKVSGKVGDLTTLSTTEKTDLVKSINEVNAKANSNATDIAGLDSSKANAADVYKKTEVDSKLSGKSDTSHTHDDRYYTETEIDTKLAGKSDTSHNHDSSYYTKTEVYTKSEVDNKYMTIENPTCSGTFNMDGNAEFSGNITYANGNVLPIFTYDSSTKTLSITTQ